MNHADVVGMFECCGDLDGDVDRWQPTHSFDITDALLQRFTVYQFHCIKQPSFLFAVSDQSHDTGVPQPTERFNLGIKSAAKSHVIGHMLSDQFDRDPVARGNVSRFVDRSHATATDDFANFVRSEMFKLAHAVLQSDRGVGEMLTEID